MMMILQNPLHHARVLVQRYTFSQLAGNPELRRLGRILLQNNHSDPDPVFCPECVHFKGKNCRACFKTAIFLVIIHVRFFKT
jgi:hypothetical protein